MLVYLVDDLFGAPPRLRMWRLCHAHIIDVDLRNQPYLFAVITFASSCCHQYRMLHFYVAIYKKKATKFRNTFVLGRRVRYPRAAKPFVFATASILPPSATAAQPQIPEKPFSSSKIMMMTSSEQRAKEGKDGFGQPACTRGRSNRYVRTVKPSWNETRCVSDVMIHALAGAGVNTKNAAGIH